MSRRAEEGKAGGLRAWWRDFWHERHWQPRPVGAAEWFWLRLLFALVVAWSFRDGEPFALAGQPRPNGLAHLIPLTFLSHPHARILVQSLAGLLLLLYVSGRGLPAALAGLTLLSTLVRTYANSQGFINHAYQIVTLTLFAQTLTLAALAWLRRRGWTPPAGLGPAGYLLFYSQGLIAGAYVTSALIKLINSRGLWVWNTVYLPLELVKSHREQYYRNLDAAYAGEVPHVAWMLGHPWLCRLLFGSGFFLELLAFLALRGRRWALALGLGLIGLHLSVEYLMTLRFHYNVALLLVFFVNLPGWIFWWRGKGRGGLVR